MTARTMVTTLDVTDCRCVRISADGTSVVTFGSGLVQVWDTASGQLGWSLGRDTEPGLPVEAVWGGASESITLLTSGRLSLLDAMTGTERQLPDELTERTDITAMALSPNGLTLAVGTHEGIVLLWQQDTGRVIRLRGGGDPVTALAWRPTANELCVARPRALQFWQPAVEVMISSVNVKDVYPTRLAWTPDGALIVVMGLTEIRVLRASTRSDGAAPLATPGRPLGLGISRSGSTVLVGMPDGSIDQLNSRLERPDVPLDDVPGALVEPACLHINETGLVGVRSGPSKVTLFALPDTELSPEKQHRAVALRRWAAAVAQSVRLDADSPASPPVPTVLATQSRFAWTDDGLYLQNSQSGEVTRLVGERHRQWSGKSGVGPLSANDDFVAVGTGEGQLTVLNAATGTQVASVAGSGPAVWSQDAMAVAAAKRRDLLVYDLSWIRNPRTVPVPNLAGDPSWSPDGTFLAAPTANAVVLWNGQTLERVRRLSIDTARRRASLAWSPDGAYLALAHRGAPATIWNTATWTPDQEVIPPGHLISDVLAWSPDSRLLAVPARQPIGAVDLWDVRRGRITMTVPPYADRGRPVVNVGWARDGRFAVVYDDNTVVQWTVQLPQRAQDEQAVLPQLAKLAAATAAMGAMVALPLLADLLSLLLGHDAGRLDEFSSHPSVAMLRGLRWPPDAVVGLALLVAERLPAAENLRPPRDAAREELLTAVGQALDGVLMSSGGYEPPITELLGELDGIDDSVLVLATLLGPEAVAAAPDLLARIRGQSFGGWSLAPRQQRLLGLRSMLRAGGSSQGHGVGDARAGIARHGELSSLLHSQLALPHMMLGLKMSRDELLFRTRQGDLVVEAQPVVLLLDDTPAAFGTVGVTIRIIANLLAGIAIRQRRRCALVPLGSARVTFLAESADLVHLWARGNVNRPVLAAALTNAGAAAAQLSDTLGGLPRLVLLTHPYLVCPSQPGLHVIRVHYPGIRVDDPAPRTHVLSPGAGPDEVHEVIGAILNDRS